MTAPSSATVSPVLAPRSPRLVLAAGVALALITAYFLLWPLVPIGPACTLPTILCAELPTSATRLAEVLSSPVNSPDLWRAHLYLDFVYVVAYVLVLGARVPLPVYRFVFLGGLFDVLENVGLLAALGEVPSVPLSSAIRLAAIGKFALLGSVSVAILTELPFAAPLWPRVRPWLTVALALVVMACAVELEPRPALVLITLACVRSVAEAARAVRRSAAA